MTARFVDVRCEFDTFGLAQLADPAQEVMEIVREEAQRLCDTRGAVLRTDRAPEVIIRRAIHAASGRDVTLVSSRWAVDASGIDIETGRGATPRPEHKEGSRDG